MAKTNKLCRTNLRKQYWKTPSKKETRNLRRYDRFERLQFLCSRDSFMHVCADLSMLIFPRRGKLCQLFIDTTSQAHRCDCECAAEDGHIEPYFQFQPVDHLQSMIFSRRILLQGLFHSGTLEDERIGPCFQF